MNVFRKRKELNISFCASAATSAFLLAYAMTSRRGCRDNKPIARSPRYQTARISRFEARYPICTLTPVFHSYNCCCSAGDANATLAMLDDNCFIFCTFVLIYCCDCEQARRMSLRYRTQPQGSEKKAKKTTAYPHTLNGSGVAVGR